MMTSGGSRVGERVFLRWGGLERVLWNQRSNQSGDRTSGRDVCPFSNGHTGFLQRRGGRFRERVRRSIPELLGAGNPTGLVRREPAFVAAGYGNISLNCNGTMLVSADRNSETDVNRSANSCDGVCLLAPSLAVDGERKLRVSEGCICEAAKCEGRTGDAYIQGYDWRVGYLSVARSEGSGYKQCGRCSRQAPLSTASNHSHCRQPFRQSYFPTRSSSITPITSEAT